MTKKYLISLSLLSIGVLAFGQGRVGIGTSTPQATLDILPKTTTNTNKALEILNSDGKTLLNGLDSGEMGFGIRENNALPVGQMTIFGENGQGQTSPASFLAKYTKDNVETGQKWGYYINPKQGDLNPALPGYFNLYMDKDGKPSEYYIAGGTAGSGYGNYFGFHDDANSLSGLFFADNGTLLLSTFRIDSNSFTSHYLTTNKSFVIKNTSTNTKNSASFRIKDENKDYTVGGTCTNPGTIALVGNDFLGCVEIYDNGVNTEQKVWKKLNN